MAMTTVVSPVADVCRAAKRAARELAALDSAVREAAARGYQWTRPLAAFLGADHVGVQVLAATSPLEDEDADDAARPGVRTPVGQKYEL